MPSPLCADADVRAVSAAQLAIARELGGAECYAEALDGVERGLAHATAAARVDADLVDHLTGRYEQDGRAAVAVAIRRDYIDDYRQGYGEGVQEYLRTILVDEVFTKDDDDDEEQLNKGALFSRLWEGKAVFRPTG